jgi:hypothetical protein
MAADTKPYDELRQLMLLAWDNLLSTEQFVRLEQLLVGDAAARQFYLEESDLYGAICWNNVKSLLAMPFHDANAASVGTTLEIDRVPSPAPPRKTATNVVLSFLAITNSALHRPVLWAILTVGTLFYGTFALISWDLRSKELHNGINNDAPVATVQRSTNVRWLNDTLKVNDTDIHAKEPLQTISGTIELKLTAGTKLVIEGPADWSVDGDNCVSLRAGRLVAHVPQQAIGFTIETPTAKVVDLGTEFGVEVSKSGATDVQVLKGKVVLHPGVKGINAPQLNQPMVLSAGEARRIESRGDNGNVIVREVALTPERFADLTAATALPPPKQIRIEGAFASSTHPDPNLDVRYLINGHGLVGDRHITRWSRTQWHSNYGDVKDVFVAFDLARPHLLDSMKVWNFNGSVGEEALFRGVKQADIYVSNSGKGDPLSKPAEWTLVIADQQFAPGTGREDYDTPTSISLGGVEARFVALVIDEALGTDSSPENVGGQRDVVGLSEVQFFGSRAKRSNLLPK